LATLAIATSPRSFIESIEIVEPATAAYTPTLTELDEGAAEKSRVTVPVVVASQRTSITSYGLAALRATTTTSRVPRLCVSVNVVADPSPIVSTWTVPAKPVSVPGANFVPSNLRT